MTRMRMMRKLTSVMFFRLVSVIVTHCSDAVATPCGYCRLEMGGWIDNIYMFASLDYKVRYTSVTVASENIFIFVSRQSSHLKRES